MNLKFFVGYHNNFLDFMDEISKRHINTYIIPKKFKKPFKEDKIRYIKVDFKYQYLKYLGKSINKYKIKDLFSNIQGNEDFIIVKNVFQPFNFVAYLISKWKGVKVIIYSQKFQGFKIKIANYFIKILLKLSLPKDTRVFSVTKIGCVDLKKYINNVKYLPFCINLKRFNKKEYRTCGKEIKILCVGKLYLRRKNHILLIKATEKLQKKYPNILFKITIVGRIETASEYFIELLEKLKKSSIKNQFIISKNINREDMNQIYINHDLFILPSYNEPASYSNLEAMASGLPVIVSKDNGTACYLEENRNGYTFKKDNLNDLIDKIEEFLKPEEPNFEKIKKFGQRSHILAKYFHDPKIIVDKFEQLLNK